MQAKVQTVCVLQPGIHISPLPLGFITCNLVHVQTDLNLTAM